MVAKEGNGCILHLDKLSFEDMAKDTDLKTEKVKEIVQEMIDLNLINQTRYEKEGVIFVPQFVNYYDDYTNKLRREYGQDTEKVAENRREYKRIEESILDMWNRLPLPKILSFSEERKSHLKKRIQNKHFVENYEKAIDKIGVSKFCLGQVNGSKWKATIDWFISNDTNYIKALEGKYDDRQDKSEAQQKLEALLK